MNIKYTVFLISFILLIASISIIINSEKIFVESSFEQEIPSYLIIEDLKIMKEDAIKPFTKISYAFIENLGQLENDDVRFYVQGGGLWFTDDGVWFEIKEEIKFNSQESGVQSLGSEFMFDPIKRIEPLEPIKYESVILKQEFVGANYVKPEGRKPLEYYSNFFYGCNSSKWKINVPSYKEIYYENLYDGIDLRYYQNKNGLKYDFIVYPGADINQIKIRYNGAEGLEIDQLGNIIIKTSMDEIIDYDLFMYQDYDGFRHYIDGSFKILDNLEYVFEISGDYNPREVLVVDPNIRLRYSSFLGELSIGYGIAVDANGSIIITGGTQSSIFPTTPGAYNRTYMGGQGDVFVTKFNHNGSALIYSTYIGGNNIDIAYDIAIDTDGNVFLTGSTRSTNYPATPGAYNTSNQQSGVDVFVTKLNTNGTKLIYSTFIIGTSGPLDTNDIGNRITIDTYGNAFVTGFTDSSNFPNTTGAYDESFNGGSDVFVLKLNRTGATLDYSTYIGGPSSDVGNGIMIDSAGNAYVTGSTGSGFPTTEGAYDNSSNGKADGFVLKLDQNGSNLIYSTFIGGNKDDQGTDVILDETGNTYITGYTDSLDFPTTNNSYDDSFNGGVWDIFVAILNKTGASLNYSTYIGGNNYDALPKITINSTGEIYIIGETDSPDFPTTDDAFDRTFNSCDAFLLYLSQNGSELLYSTYLGGNNKDYGRDIGIDSYDNIYLTGYTFSSNFPTTPNAYDTSYNGKTANVFVMKWITRGKHLINSVILKKDSIPVTKVYSRYGIYTFNINLLNTFSLVDTKTVRVILSPNGNNIQLIWNRTTDQFSKLNDPNNYVNLEQSSKAYNNSWDKWTIDFNVTFNWTYPDENLNNVQVIATSVTLFPAWFNASNMYQVENDLVFHGNLSVKDENKRTINENELVRGGEKINWSGLKVVYENTTDIYPPEVECDITIWNEDGYFIGHDSPFTGKNFTIQAIIASETDIDGDTHCINLSSIPSECDKTNETFTIRIDGDNVTFSNPIPDNKTWQTSTTITVGITITDVGGGEVQGSSVMRCFSRDNGITWNDWRGISGLTSEESITPQDTVFFAEGKNNLIKWKASDSIGNGPVESETYRILVDSKNVTFSNVTPSIDDESPIERVHAGVTISDMNSGVDASTIEYTTSLDDGSTWSSWTGIPDLKNGLIIHVKLSLTFPNGTANRIKWRASDIAGNGPTESKVYQIKVNTWLQNLIPKVELLNPKNGSIIPSTSVELSWFLMNKNLVGVKYDLFLDTINPPITRREANLTDTHFKIFDIIDGETYYWIVIPKLEDEIGWCDSGVWSFSINTSVPYPKVQLISPENGSIITSPKPTLLWSLEYDGIEKVIYNVYLDTNKNPIEYEKSENTYYLPNRILEDNTTYYWKVIPMAGNVTGPASGTWRFTVKKGYVPTFGLKLELEPMIVGVQPGGITYAKAKVTNLGEITDSVSLNIEVPPDKDVGAIVNEPITMDLEPGRIGIFNITVTATEDIEQNEVILTIVATSEKAKELGKTVEARETLTVKILRSEAPGEGKSSTEQNLWILLLIALIIIIVVIILFIKYKKHAKDELPTSETITIKPIMPSSDLEKPQEQLSLTPTIAQPPTISTPENEEKAITPGTSAPELPITSMESHEVTPQQIPQVQQKPQLPAVVKDNKNNS